MPRSARRAISSARTVILCRPARISRRRISDSSARPRSESARLVDLQHLYIGEQLVFLSKPLALGSEVSELPMKSLFLGDIPTDDMENNQRRRRSRLQAG